MTGPMTDEPRPDATDEAPAGRRANGPNRADPRRPAGYRGSLAERQDHLARPWVITVIAIFLLMLVLAFAGLPSRLTAEPTPPPLPSVPFPSGSAAPSAS